LLLEVQKVLKTIVIPANTLKSDSVLWFNILESCTNNSNTKDIYVYINNVPVFNWGASSYAARQRYFDLRLKDGKGFIAGNNYSGSHVGMNINDSTYVAPTLLVIGNTVVDGVITNTVTIEFKCQLTQLTDTYRCESFHLIIEP